MEYGGFDPETLDNIKKAYFSVFDSKLRLLDIIQTKTDTNIDLHMYHLPYKQTQMCKKIIIKKEKNSNCEFYYRISHTTMI